MNGDYKKRGVSWWHYRPFTLEANMGAADALQEMLLQTQEGFVSVFPAIPESWRKNGASFKQLRGMQGILVSSSVRDGKVKQITLKAVKTGIYNIKNVFNTGYIFVEKAGAKEKITCKPGGTFPVELKKDESCRIYGLDV